MAKLTESERHILSEMVARNGLIVTARGSAIIGDYLVRKRLAKRHFGYRYGYQATPAGRAALEPRDER
ncbi:hypothetical protein [Bosea sp. UC22_33]|uniref:hypothetical protein n=1 Tax=Bosea sp. UC22_33 TaxID=3350165 RepID=UPI00366CA680